jgi:phage terminase large subunit-like protein
MTFALAGPRAAAAELPPEFRGHQRPRIASVPPYVSSSGPEAVELAARVGQPLDDWQGYTLVEGLGEREDGRWSATEVCIIVSRQNGKGAIVETRIIAGLSLFDERLIIYSAHQFRTTQEMFGRTFALVQQSPDLDSRVIRVVRSTNEMGIEFRGGQRARFLARSAGAGRGFSADCLLLDEGYNLDNRHMDAIVPTLLARPNPQIWYFSSAGMRISVQLGRLRRRGLARDPKLAFFEWSARAKSLGDTEDDDFSDPAVWAKANPGLGTRLSLETLDLAYRTAPEGFARECLGVGEYPAEGEDWTVISREAWAALVDLDAPRPSPVAFGVDVAPGRTHTTIAAAGRGQAGLMHVEVIDHRPGTAWVVDRVVELVARYHPVALALDPAHEAGSLIASLEAAGVEVTTMSAREVAQAHGQFMELMCDSKMLRHRDDGDLNDAVAGAAQRDLSGAKAWDRRSTSTVLSPLVAATAAVWAYTKHAPTAAEPGVWTF